MQKTSLVITVLNEEGTIEKLLNALLSQETPADEIIIVDAGSKDKTTKIIKSFQKDKTIHLIVKPGANRSQGRNIGIKKAKDPIIAITDAGCVPKNDWLKNLTKPFWDKSIDVVSGFYKPTGDSILQKSLAVYTSTLPCQVRPDKFLPASRSMAFTKKIWEKVGGFPEEYEFCEDRIFVQRLQNTDAKFVFAKEAIVYWEQKNSFEQAFWQLHNYAKGDLQARYQPHLRKIAFVWLRYLVGIYIIFTFPLLLLFIIPQYLAWVIGKGYSSVKDKRAIIYLPLLQLTADLAVMSGCIAGYLQGKKASQ